MGTLKKTLKGVETAIRKRKKAGQLLRESNQRRLLQRGLTNPTRAREVAQRKQKRLLDKAERQHKGREQLGHCQAIVDVDGYTTVIELPADLTYAFRIALRNTAASVDDRQVKIQVADPQSLKRTLVQLVWEQTNHLFDVDRPMTFQPVIYYNVSAEDGCRALCINLP